MINKGIAIRTKESMPPNIKVGIVISEALPVTKMNTTPVSPRQNATGTPRRTVVAKTIAKTIKAFLLW
jgi:hypothetical protein